jgi:hypothetical protein
MRQTIIDSFCVEVYPYLASQFRDNPVHVRRACEEVLEQVKRHVDCRDASVQIVTKDVCSHCGSIWEDEVMCCEKGIAEAIEWRP